MSDQGKPPASTSRQPAEEDHPHAGDGHPAPETLAAYHAGRLAEPEAGAIREHLALCGDCTRLVLDLALFHAEMSAQAESDGAALGTAPPAAWRRLRSRLGTELGGADRARRPLRYRPAELAFAAIAAACVIGSALWIAGHAGRAGALAAAVPGSGVTRGQAGDTLTVRLTAPTTALLLPISSERSFASYRIEVYARGGTLRLTATAVPTRVAVASHPASGPARRPVPPGPTALLTLPLSAGQLAPAEYMIQAFGIGTAGGQDERVGSWRLRVLPP